MGAGRVAAWVRAEGGGGGQRPRGLLRVGGRPAGLLDEPEAGAAVASGGERLGPWTRLALPRPGRVDHRQGHLPPAGLCRPSRPA